MYSPATAFGWSIDRSISFAACTTRRWRWARRARSSWWRWTPAATSSGCPANASCVRRTAAPCTARACRRRARRCRAATRCASVRTPAPPRERAAAAAPTRWSTSPPTPARPGCSWRTCCTSLTAAAAAEERRCRRRSCSGAARCRRAPSCAALPPAGWWGWAWTRSPCPARSPAVASSRPTASPCASAATASAGSTSATPAARTRRRRRSSPPGAYSRASLWLALAETDGGRPPTCMSLIWSVYVFVDDDVVVFL